MLQEVHVRIAATTGSTALNHDVALDAGWLDIGADPSAEVLQAAATEIGSKWPGRFELFIQAPGTTDLDASFRLKLRHRQD